MRAVAQEFRRALQAEDGARACRLLTAHAKTPARRRDAPRASLSIDAGDPETDGALTLRDDRASLATRSGGRTRGIAFIKTDDGWRLENLPLSTTIVDGVRPSGVLRALLAGGGAKIATRAQDLAFAAADTPTTAVRKDTRVGQGRRLADLLHVRRERADPGLAEVIKDPERRRRGRLRREARSQPDVVARARTCAADG